MNGTSIASILGIILRDLKYIEKFKVYFRMMPYHVITET